MQIVLIFTLSPLLAPLWCGVVSVTWTRDATWICPGLNVQSCQWQAAAYMRKLVQHAYNKWTTGFYDYVQYVQNAIPK